MLRGGQKNIYDLSLLGESGKLLLPGHSLSLEELVVSRSSSEATKATTLPSTVWQNRLIMHRHCVDVYGAGKIPN